MLKKTIKVLGIIIFTSACLILTACSLSNSKDKTLLEGHWYQEGLYLPCDNGADMIIIDDYGPVSMTPDNDSIPFDGLTAGDKIRVEVYTIEEIYPARAVIYNLEKLSDGEYSDIDAAVISSLQGLGWLGESEADTTDKLPLLTLDDVLALSEKGDSGTVIEISQNVYDEIGRLQESDSLPQTEYTLEVTGLSVPVSFYISAPDENQQFDIMLTAYGQSVTLSEEIWLYGNCGVNLYEYGDAVIFTWDYYGIGYAYVLSSAGIDTIIPETNDSAMIFLDDSGELSWQCSNNYIASIIQTGGLSVAASYDTFLRSTGKADIVDGKIVFGEQTEYLTISDCYDLDREFADMYVDNPNYSGIEDVFESNKKLYVAEGWKKQSFTESGIYKYNGGIAPVSDADYIVNVTVPEDWQYADGIFDENGDKRSEIAAKLVTGYTEAIFIDELKSNASDRVFDIENPIAGTTDSGLAYLGYCCTSEYYTKGETVSRYLFHVQVTDEWSVWVDVWKRHDIDGDDYLDSIVLPYIRSLDVILSQ